MFQTSSSFTPLSNHPKDIVVLDTVLPLSQVFKVLGKIRNQKSETTLKYVSEAAGAGEKESSVSVNDCPHIFKSSDVYSEQTLLSKDFSVFSCK